MTDDDIKRIWGRYACDAWWTDALPRFRAIEAAARAEGAREEREACAALCERVKLESNDVDDLHRAWGADRCLSLIRSRSAAGGGGR